MQIYRTRFAKDIVAEFLPPATKSNKVMIIAYGVPSVPGKKELLEYFAKKGYWVFFPRYRGSWESRGWFLKKSPERDILDVINQLPQGFINLSSGKKYSVVPKKLYILAGSFGGPAGILASRDSRVDKVIGISPVVDWTAPSKAEPLHWLAGYMREAFGEGYRFKAKDWRKLQSGRFYNPSNHLSELNPEKLFVIHAKDDQSVSARSVKKFSKQIGCQLLLLPKGGHLSSTIVMKPNVYKKIKKFLNAKIQ